MVSKLINPTIDALGKEPEPVEKKKNKKKRENESLFLACVTNTKGEQTKTLPHDNLHDSIAENIWRGQRRSDHGVAKALPEPTNLRSESTVPLVQHLANLPGTQDGCYQGKHCVVIYADLGCRQVWFC